MNYFYLFKDICIGMFTHPFNTLDRCKEKIGYRIFIPYIVILLIINISGGWIGGIISLYLISLYIIIHITSAFFGGNALFHETLGGMLLSFIPLFIGYAFLMIIGFFTSNASSIIELFAIFVFWPSLGFSLINTLWMIRSYHHLGGMRLFFTILAILVQLGISTFIMTFLLISTART